MIRTCTLRLVALTLIVLASAAVTPSAFGAAPKDEPARGAKLTCITVRDAVLVGSSAARCAPVRGATTVDLRTAQLTACVTTVTPKRRLGALAPARAGSSRGSSCGTGRTSSALVLGGPVIRDLCRSRSGILRRSLAKGFACAAGEQRVWADAARANVLVSIRRDGSAPLVRGTRARFVVDVENRGPRTATDVQAQLALPSGATLVAGEPLRAAQLARGKRVSATFEIVVPNVSTATFGAAATWQQRSPSGPVGRGSSEADGLAIDLAAPAAPAPVVDPPVIVPPAPTLTRLDATLAASAVTPSVGAEVTFTLDVVNSGATDAPAEATVELPGNLTLTAADADATFDTAANTVRWSATVAAGATLTRTVSAVVGSSYLDTQAATVQVTSSLADAGSQLTDTATIDPPNADLSVTVDAGGASGPAGAARTATIVVTNEPTAQSATTASVWIDIPYGYSLATPGSGSFNSTTNVWTVGSLAPGASSTLTIDYDLSGTNGTFGAYTRSSVVDSDASNDTATANVTITPPAPPIGPTQTNLAVSVATAGPRRLNVGDLLSFVVDASVLNGADGSGIAISAPLPSGFTLVSAAPTQGAYDPTMGLWYVGSIASATTQRLTLTVRLAAGPGSVSATRASATAIALDQFDPIIADNSGILQFVPLAADLEVDAHRTVVDLASPSLSDARVYTVTVRNNGGDAATGVISSSILPGGATLVDTIAGQGSYDPAAGVWTIGSIPAGAVATLVLAAQTNAGPNVFTASLSASDQFDPTTGNNTVIA